MTLIPLFSVPIFIDKIDLDFEQQSNVVGQISYDYIHDGNYFISSNVDILNTGQFVELKQEILKKIDSFAHNTLKINKKIKFYITTSWIVKFPKNSWAQKHIHSNSIFSGVVYLNTASDGGEICFHKDNRYHNISYPTLELVYDDWSEYTSDYWKLKPNTGDIFLFPSNLTHSVEKNLSDNERISLAFNVFARGVFGTHESSIEI